MVRVSFESWSALTRPLVSQQDTLLGAAGRQIPPPGRGDNWRSRATNATSIAPSHRLPATVGCAERTRRRGCRSADVDSLSRRLSCRATASASRCLRMSWRESLAAGDRCAATCAASWPTDRPLAVGRASSASADRRTLRRSRRQATPRRRRVRAVGASAAAIAAPRAPAVTLQSSRIRSVRVSCVRCRESMR